MTPVGAIHTATRNIGPAARIDSGEVAEGFLADLLIVDADPTVDVTSCNAPNCAARYIKDGKFAYLNPELYP